MSARPLRVAHIITKLDVGGAQETAVRCCVGLRARGHDAVLVSGRHGSDAGPIAAEARAAGIPVTYIPELARRVSLRADVIAVVRLASFFRRLRPDVVHTHSSKAGMVGRLAAVAARVPVRVHTVHGWSFHEGMPGPVRRAAILAERALARFTSALVVVTLADEATGARHRIGRPERYRVIHSGVDLTAYGRRTRASARATLGIDDDRPVVGAVTRLAPQKDPATWAAVATAVAERVPDVQFVIIGDGPGRAEMAAVFRAAGIAPQVAFVGERRDVADLLPAFDVFLLTSRWEGLPRVVVEAMASGVPVVATAVGGVPEIVEDSRSGLLGPVGAADVLAEQVLRLLEDPPLAEALASEGRRRVAVFGEDHMVDEHTRLYGELTADLDERVVTARSGHVAYRLVAPIDDEIAAAVARRGRPYEELLLRVLARLARGRRGAFIDVGANIGNHAMFMGAHGIPVVALEPNPDACRFLERNVKENGLDHVVEIVPCAAGSEPGRGRMVAGVAGGLGMASFEQADGGDVDVIRLDDIDQPASIVKIDVEGGELDVLDGARRLITEHRPIVVVETWDGRQRGAVDAMLVPLAYRRFPVSFCATPTHIWLPDRRLWLRALAGSELLELGLRRALVRARSIVRVGRRG